MLLMLVACAGPVQAESPLPAHPDLLNGDFSAGIDSGWSRFHQDYVGYTEFKPMREGGISVRKVMCGYARLAQRVELPDTRRSFSTRVRAKAQVNKPGYYGYSAVVLTWLDDSGEELGETRFYTRSGTYTPRKDATHHPVQLTTTDDWQDLSVDIASELRTNLPGLKPASVKGLVVTYESYTSGRDAC